MCDESMEVQPPIEPHPQVSGSDIAATQPCHIYAHGKVYDVSGYAEQHPGGPNAILKRIGQDATKDYDFHSKQGKQAWTQMRVNAPYEGGEKSPSRTYLLSRVWTMWMK